MFCPPIRSLDLNMKKIRLVFESFGFAVNALRENILRTALSLSGITIGIFAIIGVLTLVDSLDRGMKESMSFLGDKVLYVEKWPWQFGGEYKWWDYFRRPYVTEAEYAIMEKNLTKNSGISLFAYRGNLTAKYRSNNISPIFSQGVSFGHSDISEITLAAGRYFTRREAENGANVAIIGFDIAQNLFGSTQAATGKEFKLKNRKFRVVGVFSKQGENLMGAPSSDMLCMMPFKMMRKMFAGGRRGLSTRLGLKGYENDPGLEELEGEARGLMRRIRSLKPKEKDNFAINRSESITVFLDSLIAVLKGAGWFIGSFSILVGGFGIANIMFVSVKERTNLIGIQKSLGAKNYFILTQFLFESILLCLIGGAGGLLLVSLLTFFSSESFQITLSSSNIILGLSVSCTLGILAGVIPAWMAARMDPVTAIRTN